MKKLFAIAALIIATGPVIIDPVFAADREETRCRSTGVADAGYILKVASDLKTATLEEETFAGPRPPADLDCRLLPVKHFLDSLDNYLLCQDARAPQKGLIVRLFQGGFAGVHYASVRRQNFGGGMPRETEIQFGHLNCK